MENLRWILIIAGVAILVLLYFSGRPKKPSSRRSSSRLDAENLFDEASSGASDPLMGDSGDGRSYDRFDTLELDDLSRPSARGHKDVEVFDHDATGTAMGEDSLFPADERSTLSAKFEDFASRLSPKRWQRVKKKGPAGLTKSSLCTSWRRTISTSMAHVCSMCSNIAVITLGI